MKKILFLFSLLVFTVSVSAQIFKYQPTASATIKGLLSNTDWTTFNNKFTLPALTSGSVIVSNGTTLVQDNANLFWDDTNNRLGVGTNTPTTELQVVSTSSSDPRGFMSSQYSTDNLGARIHLRKSRGTIGTPTSVAANDILGRIRFSGYDGSNFLQMGTLDVGVIGTPASTKIPTYMSFSTATDATPSVLTEAMRISDAQFVGIGTITPSSKLDITTNSLGVTQTNSSGLSLVNETAAAVGAQQISPGLRFRGYGWKTTATAASQSVDFRMHVLPVEGTTAPTGSLVFQSSINGAAYADRVTISSAGALTSTSVSTGSITISGSLNNVNSGIVQIGGAGSIPPNMYVNTIQSSVGIGVTAATAASAKLEIVGRLPSGVAANSIINMADTWNTSGNPTAILANITNTASGPTSNLMDLQIGGSSLFKIGKGGDINVAKTITTPGTTGNQTINKIAGTVNIAAAGTTVTVTNSLVTANSIIMCTVQTNDTTAVLKNVVPGAGSFVINLNAATTAETAIAFFVIN